MTEKKTKGKVATDDVKRPSKTALAVEVIKEMGPKTSPGIIAKKVEEMCGSKVHYNTVYAAFDKLRAQNGKGKVGKKRGRKKNKTVAATKNLNIDALFAAQKLVQSVGVEQARELVNLIAKLSE